MSNTENVLKLYEELAEAQKQSASAEAEIKKIKAKLCALIEPNTSKHGVKHVQTERTTVQYKDALSKIVDTLVPKSKHETASTIVSSCTTVTKVTKFVLDIEV
jgi:hypothetical protein